MQLEVIRNTERRCRKHLITVGIKDVARKAEGRCLHHEAAILRTDVPTGTQFIRHTAAEETTDVNVALGVKVGGAGVLKRVEEHYTRTSFEEWIEVLEVQIEDICDAELLLQSLDTPVCLSEDLIILCILLIAVIGFECAARRQQIAVAG